MGKFDPCNGSMDVGGQGGVLTRNGRPVPYKIIRRFSQEVIAGD